MGGNAREEDVKHEGKRRRNKRKEKTSWRVRVTVMGACRCGGECVDCVQRREYGEKCKCKEEGMA